MGKTQWLLPYPLTLFLAACVPHLGSRTTPSDTVSDVGAWTVSASSPVDSGSDGAAAAAAPPSDSPSRAASDAEAGAGTGDASAPRRPSAETAHANELPEPTESENTAGAPAPSNSGTADGPDNTGQPATRASGLGAGDLTLTGMTLTEQMQALRQALTVERQRRESAELQLQRLKDETSVPAFGAPQPPMVPQRDLLAAKQDIVYLRQALEDERAARQRLAEELLALQTKVAEAPPPANPELLAHQEEAAVNFHRSFADSQAAAEALDAQLAAGTESSDLGTVRAENLALRSRLEEQHRRTQELGEKLKVATRVADLIFKLEARTAGDAPVAQAAAKPAAPRVAARAAAAPPARPARVQAYAPPSFADADDISGYDAETRETPTPGFRATPSPTQTLRLPTPTPTPTHRRHTPAVPAMPVPA